VERLCQAAAELLEEEGLAALTTNAVAARAGLSVTAVYAYFPDKYALVHELFERGEQRRVALIGPFIRDVARGPDWRASVRAGVEAMAADLVTQPGATALRGALLSIPALHRVDVASGEEVASAVAAALRVRRPSLAPARAEGAAVTLVTAVSAVLDRACEGSRVDEPLLAEAVAMAVAYLEAVFADGDGTTG
jgi:AcrR family transcriptional regulator